MKPYYQDASVTIYHGDCREVSVPSNCAVVTDPPYGMRWNTDSTRFSGGKHKRGDGRSDYGAIAGDAVGFDPTPWLAFPSVVLWGANHFASALPVGTWLVWIKKHDHLFGTFLSDAELAWSKGGHGVYAMKRSFPPPSRAKEAGAFGVHPTQKPLALMRWCIESRTVDETVLDPYMGSGTTLVSAKSIGRTAIGIEVDERYCEIAARRCSQETMDLGAA